MDPLIEKEDEIPFPPKMTLLMSKPPTLVRMGLLEHQGTKRKKMPLSGLEMNEGSVEENNPGPNKTSKTDSSEHISSNRKTPLHLKDPTKQRNSKRGPSGKATSTENPNLEEPVLSIQTLSSKRSLEFTSEQIHSPDVSRWNEPQAPLNTYPEQLWQGFPNVGNTCYMNAILQSLFAIPSFTDDLLMQGVPWEKIPFDALIMCVSQLLALKDICDMETKGELLVNVKRTISAVAETFSGNMQNDAYEFLGYCLDQLKEDMAKLNTALETERETRLDSSSPKTYANKAAPQQAFLCPVVANFEFELQHSIICQACGQIVVKTEPNNYLSINLPQETKLPSFSIQNSFDLFFRAEELEYSCKACKHKTAVGMRKFSRLPRVLIVHLKRYSFDDVWLLVKDNQQVDIPKFLSLSSHCNESTKPPFPIARDVPPGNPQILNLPPEVISEFNKLTPSVKWISETSDSLARTAQPQNVQKLCEWSSQEQQQTILENSSKRDITESGWADSGDGKVPEKELPTAGSGMDQGDTCLMICEEEREPTSSPHTSPTKICSQVGPEDPEHEKYEEINTLVDLDFDNVTQSADDFCKANENRIPERSQGVAEQLQQCHVELELHQQEPPLTVRILDSQEHTEKNFKSQQDLHSLGALGSDMNAGILDPEDTEAEAKALKSNAEAGDPLHTYQLVSVVSHLGSSPDSGHYISDVYDFQKQAWFTFNDLQVSEIDESVMREARLRTGYIVFYMHRDIFQALLGKTRNSQLLAMWKGEIPQEE